MLESFAALWRAGCLLLALGVMAACAPQETQTFSATLPATQNSAPVYTPTFTLTPSVTPTITPTSTATPTLTPTPSPTLPVQTLTPASPDSAPPPAPLFGAEISDDFGWTCDDFPCEHDIDGFLRRIQVPPGFRLSHGGRLPGQPMQITYGRDGLLYATILENGTRNGAVYRLLADGTAERYSGDFVSPLGLAFQPGTDVLYVSARVTLEQGGGVWRVPAGGEPEPVVTDLPCCFQIIDNQPNGLTFGPDGYIYMGVGALTDQGEPPPGPQSQYAAIQPHEAAILRIHPHTGEITFYARGIRNPYDLTFTSAGQMYATDNGMLVGAGDRLLQVNEGANYGWPFWGERGCDRCPPRPPDLQITPDLLTLRPLSLPRGIVAYSGTQFPANMFDSLFVALWNDVTDGQRVVRIDPARIPTTPEGLEQYRMEPFVTGLIRPIDVAIAPDGALMVADYVYGHVWRVAYEG